MLLTSFKHIDAKRLIGRKFSDSAVQTDMKQWSFTVVDDNTKPKVQVDYKVSNIYEYPYQSFVITKLFLQYMLIKK